MSKTNKNTMDMTHGTLWNKILIFALPLAASSILQQLFNSIDTACCRTVCQQSGTGGSRQQQFADCTDD